MANITIPGLPSKTGTVDDAAYLHLNESGVDKKMTISQMLTKISDQYDAIIQTLLASTDEAEARDAIKIDRRTTFSDANYTILNTDLVVAQIGTMSAARTLTLPAANTFKSGGQLIIIDESGSVTSTNKITVQRASTDTIEDSTFFDILLPYGILVLICDGSSKWKIKQKNHFNNQQITIANNSSDSNNDIDFSSGFVHFSDGYSQTFASAFTKRLDASWSYGSNQGGLFSGSKANSTWYHCFVIYNPSTRITDFGFDTSISAANIPSGYTKYKRVGSIRTNSSGNILTFVQAGNNFILSVPILDINSTGSTSATLNTLTVPSGVNVFANISYWADPSAGVDYYGLITSPLQEDTIPSISNFNASVELANENRTICPFSILTNTSSQIRTRWTASTDVSQRIFTYGWTDYQL